MPVFFPPEGGLGHAPVDALPVPCDADLSVVLVEGGLPQLAEHAALLPPLEVPVEGGTGTELGRSRLPLTSGPQDVEDAVENVTLGQGWPPTLAGSTDAG